MWRRSPGHSAVSSPEAAMMLRVLLTARHVYAPVLTKACSWSPTRENLPLKDSKRFYKAKRSSPLPCVSYFEVIIGHPVYRQLSTKSSPYLFSPFVLFLIFICYLLCSPFLFLDSLSNACRDWFYFRQDEVQHLFPSPRHPCRPRSHCSYAADSTYRHWSWHD